MSKGRAWVIWEIQYLDTSGKIMRERRSLRHLMAAPMTHTLCGIPLPTDGDGYVVSYGEHRAKRACKRCLRAQGGSDTDG